MSKNPFIILGVDEETVNQNELEQAYRTLRAKYEDDRFLEGEAGEEATRKISEIDQAYEDAREKLMTKSTVTDKGISYTEIENQIRAKNFNQAQAMLDSIVDRNAEWHFLQSVIYYKKGWVSESMVQLKLAVNLDPSNVRYQTELQRLKENVEGPQHTNYNYQRTNQHGDPYYRGDGYDRSYGPTRPSNTNGTCDICSTLCALDCCCECMGGDLITCC